MPGKHVPPGPLSKANDFLGAVTPTNGWLVELGYLSNKADRAAERNCVLKVGYCIYIYRDTQFVDEMKEIPKRLKDQQLMLILPLGNVDVTIPIHYDNCSVFMSPLSDFKEEMAKTQHKAVCPDHGKPYAFNVRD
ncbi:hypothetical protein PLIIFM63780_002137 [Purpureocillium lilacinum]|uniref:Uncharacterized protein n=1 Tax=Purpureocillium lilacinum TaxID=33203 RepID=A0ACC4D988_PURLI|nr:hypothetical protein PLIIFM63780_002137 [Purpureocillium lilacinum]